MSLSIGRIEYGALLAYCPHGKKVGATPEERRAYAVMDTVKNDGMLASANKLADAYEGVQIRGFAVIRTQSDPFAFKHDNGPRVGTIALQDNGRTSRRP